MRKKLSQNRGETLVEVLAAVLIAALSVALLFGGVMASSTIGRSALTSDKSFYEDLSGAESQKEAGTDLTVTVSREGASTEPTKLTVKRYGGAGAYSYAKEGAP